MPRGGGLIRGPPINVGGPGIMVGRMELTNDMLETGVIPAILIGGPIGRTGNLCIIAACMASCLIAFCAADTAAACACE